MSKDSFNLLLCRHSVAKTELKIELANGAIIGVIWLLLPPLYVPWQMEVTTDRYNYVIMTRWFKCTLKWSCTTPCNIYTGTIRFMHTMSYQLHYANTVHNYIHVHYNHRVSTLYKQGCHEIINMHAYTMTAHEETKSSSSSCTDNIMKVVYERIYIVIVNS